MQHYFHHLIPRSTRYKPPKNIFLHTLVNLHVGDDTWDNTTHISHIGVITYIKIKSHQLTSLGHIRSSTRPLPCLTLVHVNHWDNQTAEILNSTEHNQWVLLQCSQHRIRIPLYTHPCTLYYGLCPIDTDVPSFIHNVYQ